MINILIFSDLFTRFDKNVNIFRFVNIAGLYFQFHSQPCGKHVNMFFTCSQPCGKHVNMFCFIHNLVVNMLICSVLFTTLCKHVNMFFTCSEPCGKHVNIFCFIHNLVVNMLICSLLVHNLVVNMLIFSVLFTNLW